jgi:cystathionine gamma-synthase
MTMRSGASSVLALAYPKWSRNRIRIAPLSLHSGETPSSCGELAHAMRRKIEGNKQSNPSMHWRTSMATQLSHAGLSICESQENSTNFNAPLSPPINLATTFERPSSGEYGDGGLIYSRSCNPTRKLLEDAIGRLEMNFAHADGSCRHDTIAPTFAFSSGMAAVASLLLACRSPVKLLIPKDVYHGLPTQLYNSFSEHGVSHESVDMTNLNELQQTLEENTESGGSLIVWTETPSNPLCQVTDIQAVANIVQKVAKQKHHGRIMMVVDSTWAPPCITLPLSLGADVVLHSGTKYLGGHSDVLLGVASCSPLTGNGRWLAGRLKAVQTSVGAVASPLECWLTLRGLRTLHLRVERQCQTAMKLAEYLHGHKHVIKCHYPGLKCHPQHIVAGEQMSMFGGMLSFEVESEQMAMAVAGAVHIIRRATSLGGTETLIEHRASIEPAERRTSPSGLLRLSVGLEDWEDLKHDLEVALDVASQIVNASK